MKFLPGRFHEATAPSSIERFSSAINLFSSSWRTLPVPPQFLQAPSELKAKSSALNMRNLTPQVGQVIIPISAPNFAAASAISKLEVTLWPLGQTGEPNLEKIKRRTLKVSVVVPTVARSFGTLGR